MLLMGAPAEFGGLSALAHEAVDRPGIDELIRRLRHVRHLGVALGDMHDLDAKSPRERSPRLAAAGLSHIHPGIFGDVEQGLLSQVRNQARIRAMGGTAVGESCAPRRKARASRRMV